MGLFWQRCSVLELEAYLRSKVEAAEYLSLVKIDTEISAALTLIDAKLKDNGKSNLQWWKDACHAREKLRSRRKLVTAALTAAREARRHKFRTKVQEGMALISAGKLEEGLTVIRAALQPEDWR